MELSKRLQAVADLVTAGYIMADIGTDHAYIPIYLMEHGLNPSAIALDINEGPLGRAREHVEEKGMSDRIKLRLSDGLAELLPGEAESAVLAGMGGGLMIRILKNSPEITAGLKECILQPQSEIARVRAFLLEEGFLFIQEDMILEDGKFYPMMKVKTPSADQPHAESWSEVEIRYGKYLLEGRHPVLKEFLEREITLKSEILKNLEKQNSKKAGLRTEELREELNYARKGLEYYAL